MKKELELVKQERGILKKAVNFTDVFKPIVNLLLYHDNYMLLADYNSYFLAQGWVDQQYQNQEAWTRMSLLNMARCGYFSSDRTIQE